MRKIKKWMESQDFDAGLDELREESKKGLSRKTARFGAYITGHKAMSFMELGEAKKNRSWGKGG